MTDLALALDAGGTKVLGGLVTATGDVRVSLLASTSGVDGADPGLRVTLGVVDDLLRAAPEHGDVVAVGAGFPEYVHDGELRSHEVMAWRGQPAQLLADRVPGVPVAVESDVRCGALAEARLGGGADCPSVLYVSWGTGLSSALVLDGVPFAGHRGEAIALGELGVPATVDPTWPDNLERYASGAGIAARYAHRVAAPSGQSARTVAARADAGDATAVEVLTTAGRAVGVATAWLVAVLDPTVVVLGGGVGTAATLATRAAHTSYREAVSRRPAPPPLVPATLGDTTGLVGAALRAHDLRG